MTTGATGYISILRDPDGTVVWEWHEGDTVWLTYQLLKSMGISRPASDDVFTFGPFTLRCTMHRIKEQVIEAVRVSHDSNR